MGMDEMLRRSQRVRRQLATDPPPIVVARMQAVCMTQEELELAREGLHKLPAGKHRDSALRKVERELEVIRKGGERGPEP